MGLERDSPKVLEEQERPLAVVVVVVVGQEVGQLI